MNHHLVTVCTSCGSFIQQKIDNIDLFETAWHIIESPARAFRSIALAKHKNYAIVLSAIAGIGFAFTLFWFLNVGDVISELLLLLFFGLVSGPIIGPILMLVFSLIVRTLAVFSKVPLRFRNIFAVASYSLVPIIVTVFTLLPIELLTFGVFMFSKNPSPYTIKPFSYVVIIALDSVCGLWAVALFVVGMKVLLNANWRKSIFLAVTSVLIFIVVVMQTAIHVYSKLVFR